MSITSWITTLNFAEFSEKGKKYCREELPSITKKNVQTEVFN